jgi:hypothetical protein
MIRINIDIQEHKNGKVSIESQVGTHKEAGVTALETEVASKIKEVLTVLMTSICSLMPDSQIATNEEDVETLRGLEDLEFEGG